MNVTAINYAGPNAAGASRTSTPYYAYNLPGLVNAESGPWVAGNQSLTGTDGSGIATNGYYLWLAIGSLCYTLSVVLDGGLPFLTVSQSASTPPSTASSYVTLLSNNGSKYALSLVSDGGIITTSVGQTPVSTAAATITLKASNGVAYTLSMYTDSGITSLRLS